MSTTKNYKGLTLQQVEQSRLKHGENILTPPPRRSMWSLLLEKFQDPIIIILLFALVLCVAVAAYQYLTGLEGGHVFMEPLGIFVSIILATTVGFIFEHSANKRFEILNAVGDEAPVRVMRAEGITLIGKREVVVGDIIILETGDEIPADCELLEAVSLQVNESTLTGEPITRKTTLEAEFSTESTYPSSHVMRGTSVVEGHAVARVFAVGDATDYGKVYEGAQIDNSVVTPLNKQLNGLALLITKASYIIATAIVVGRLALYISHLDGFDWIHFGAFILNTVMIAVTVIVVAVPEGLPMSVTLSLALSMKRMLSTNNLVRKMQACETMGATTVICTDKTGTLTQNQMRVHEVLLFADSSKSELFEEAIALNTTAHLDLSKPRVRVIGNPTEGALLLWLRDQERDYMTLREQSQFTEQLPFSTERKYMATAVESGAEGCRVLHLKGAPEVIMSLCQSINYNGTVEPLEPHRAAIEAKLLECQNAAKRTLAFAYERLGEGQEAIRDGELQEPQLTLLGVVAISDPVREEVPGAIRDAIAAGISIKIVTGDTSATACEIGRQISLWEEGDGEQNLLTGGEFAAMSDEELLSRLPSLKILSRAKPMDKLRLVRLLQSQGEVVAVTGDGTNDAPALKAAQVGLSMGDGTSVAKEASDITIIDNSFSSITRAVMWGRSLYQNIQRFILFQLTINVAACLIVLLGIFVGSETPLTVTQMLWVNLIMDTFAALALASLPPSAKVMEQKPRHRNDHIISKAMARRIVGVGGLFVVLLFGLLQYFTHEDITTLADFSIASYVNNYFNFNYIDGGLSPYELSLFFTTFVMLQLWNMFNAKAFMSSTSALSKPHKYKAFFATLGMIFVGQILIINLAGEMFSVVPIKIEDWVTIIVTTSLVAVVGEVWRLVVRR
ncbi:MAG: calcium-translocating P-type ATPase, PMCA-type [Rikenellaceae bacterium]